MFWLVISGFRLRGPRALSVRMGLPGHWLSMTAQRYFRIEKAAVRFRKLRTLFVLFRALMPANVRLGCSLLRSIVVILHLERGRFRSGDLLPAF